MTSDPSASRGRYNTGLRRREEILDAAVRVFGSRGYGAATIKQIADEVGVTPAAVLRYFRKEELLTEVLRRWDHQQPFVGDAGPGLTAIRAWADLMRYHVEHRGFLELFLTFATEASDVTHPAHAFIYQRYQRTSAAIRGHLVEAVELGQLPPMDEASIAFEGTCFHAVIDGLEIQWLLNSTLDLAALVSEHVEHSIARWERGAATSLGAGSVPSWP